MMIVSFTSYPKRINTVHKVLDSIIKQTVLPDKIILYLSSSEFENFGELPDFREYEGYGFEIHWHEENLKSHKKWFYAFQEYKEDIVITIDDDILYNNNALENLLLYHKQFPDCVVARNANLITCNEDRTIAPYESWRSYCAEYIGMPRMDMEAVGNGGILYPVYLFDNEILFRKEVFMEKCPYADDLWMKIMEIYSGIPTVLAEKRWDDLILEEHQVNCLYQDYNKNGGNDSQLKELLEEYPYTVKKEKLIDSIFRKGYMTSEEARKSEEKEMDTILVELIEKIRDCEELLIYGAGDAGNRIYRLLTENDVGIIKAFIVKNTVNNVNMVGNIEVRNYKEFINGNEKILIALFDDNQTKEVCLELVKEGVDQARIISMDNFEKIALVKRVWMPIDSREYWEKRYTQGGNSGSGSYAQLAEFKAEIINEFVRKAGISNVIEWGCGDGNQLKLAEYPAYVGLDVSLSAIKMCNEKFELDETKKFVWCGGSDFINKYQADLAISLDVIYHLIEDEVYEQYMERLFASSKKYICIYSSNFEKQTAAHVKHRKFTDWIKTNAGEQWELFKFISNKYPYSESDQDNTSRSDFYFYIKK